MAFDPKRYVIKVQGGREYLPVSARLIWFRSEHPDWGIVTEAVELNHEKQYAIFRATIFNEEGRLIATATKKEDVRGFGDFIEKAECVPLSTQILTAEGWKTHAELRIGEPVLAYDADSDRLRWAPLLAVRAYPQAPVVRLHNTGGFDVVCTPDHKWHTRHQQQELCETQRLRAGMRLTVAAPGPTDAPGAHCLPVTPEQAAVMGQLITQGEIRYYDKHLRGSLSGPSTAPGAREPLSSEYLQDLHGAFGITHETQLPHVIAYLTPEARKSLLEAMTLSQPDRRGSFAQMQGRGGWVIDLWTALCALEGSTVCRSVIRPTYGGIWTARRKKTRFVYASNLTQDAAGRQDVWCPQTPFGTWVARFANDVVTITGNTGSVGRALAMCGYGAQFAPELEEPGPRRGTAPVRPAQAPAGGPANFGPPQRLAPPPPQAASRPLPPPPRDEEPPFEPEELAPPPPRPAPRPQPMAELPADLPPLRPASSLQRPAPRPQPTEPPHAPPTMRAMPAGAPLQRVREPERNFADPGGDEELDELDDPFAEEDAPPPPPARQPARPAPTGRPAPRKPSDSLL